MKGATRTRRRESVTSLSRRRVLSTCGACSLVFDSVEAFDAHRKGSYERGTRRCMSTEELASAGFAADDSGVLRLAQPTKERRMRVRAASGAA